MKNITKTQTVFSLDDLLEDINKSVMEFSKPRDKVKVIEGLKMVVSSPFIFVKGYPVRHPEKLIKPISMFLEFAPHLDHNGKDYLKWCRAVNRLHYILRNAAYGQFN